MYLCIWSIYFHALFQIKYRYTRVSESPDHNKTSQTLSLLFIRRAKLDDRLRCHQSIIIINPIKTPLSIFAFTFSTDLLLIYLAFGAWRLTLDTWYWISHLLLSTRSQYQYLYQHQYQYQYVKRDIPIFLLHFSLFFFLFYEIHLFYLFPIHSTILTNLHIPHFPSSTYISSGDLISPQTVITITILIYPHSLNQTSRTSRTIPSNLLNYTTNRITYLLTLEFTHSIASTNNHSPSTV